VSPDERRALALIFGLLVLGSLARWVERPRPVLADATAVDLPALEEASRAAKPPPRASGPPPRPLDPNTAPAAELELIPGIGPAVAGRIVEERQNGAFVALEDLARVRGIGPALLARMEPHLLLQRRREVAAASPHPGPPGTRSGPVDLNRAGVDELVLIRGVGPVLAARLVARRDSLGGFRGWDDVDGVPGVGPTMLLRLKELAFLGN
jgi:DNA uptake protein ComE-like DNA-binding protein